jgi:thiol-disulfide isomerase/thioredoxin
MAATESKMVPLGAKAPSFYLIDVVSGRTLSLDELKSNIATVVMFICNHCPYVKHINQKLVELTNYYIEKGISFIGINSNDVVNYPEDSPENMKIQAKELGYKFPYLFDETQEVAKAYNAACTPDFYIFDRDLKLVYRGQFDDSRPGNDIPVTGKDLSEALEAIINNKQITFEQKPSIGCNIKWKKIN